MRRLLIPVLFLLIFWVTNVNAQKTTSKIIYTAGVPAVCVNGYLYVNSLTGLVYAKQTPGGCVVQGGAISGSGANTRVAFWDGAGSLSSDADFTFTTGTNTLASPFVNVTDTLDVAGAGLFRFTSRLLFSSPADGQLLLRDSGGTTFGRLMFGGTSASFPSLDRNGTSLRVLRADGTGNAISIDSVAASSFPTLSAVGSDANLNIGLLTKGGGSGNVIVGVGIGTATPTSSITWGQNGRLLDVTAAGMAGSGGICVHSGSAGQESCFGAANGGGFFMDIAGNATATNNFIAFRTEETNAQSSPTERARITSTGVFNTFFGSAVASASAIVPTGNSFHVTGTTTITSVTATGLIAGTQIVIIFDGALTFTDGSNLKLAGNFVTTADDTITLIWDGSFWYELDRSVN